MSTSSSILVAIDGPSASGKSTVSSCVAERLGFTYVDSGALYRGVTWKAWKEGVEPDQHDEVVALLDRMSLECREEQHSVRFVIDGEDPGESLRSEAVVERVSDMAAIPEVREYIGEKLKEVAAKEHVVMEGRDIGTVVFTATPFKFYLDADPEERARRRHVEMKDAIGPSGVDEVLDSLTRRDRKDSTRRTAPLQIAGGARVINTTSMSIEDVVNLIVSEIRASGVVV